MQDDALFGLIMAATMIFLMFLPSWLFKPPSQEKQEEIIEAYIKNEFDKMD